MPTFARLCTTFKENINLRILWENVPPGCLVSNVGQKPARVKGLGEEVMHERLFKDQRCQAIIRVDCGLQF